MTKQLDWSFAGPNAILQYYDKSSILFPIKKKSRYRMGLMLWNADQPHYSCPTLLNNIHINQTTVTPLFFVGKHFVKCNNNIMSNKKLSLFLAA